MVTWKSLVLWIPGQEWAQSYLSQVNSIGGCNGSSQRWSLFLVEKLGLEVAYMGGIEEDMAGDEE